MTVLTGCHDDAGSMPEQSPSASAESSAAGLRGGTFNANLPSGASVRITLPATPPPDEDVEKLRQDAGIERALYAKISIDNRQGREPVSVSRLVLTAEDGAIYRLDALPKAVPDWSSTRATTVSGKMPAANGCRKRTPRISTAGSRTPWPSTPVMCPWVAAEMKSSWAI